MLHWAVLRNYSCLSAHESLQAILKKITWDWTKVYYLPDPWLDFFERKASIGGEVHTMQDKKSAMNTVSIFSYKIKSV